MDVRGWRMRNWLATSSLTIAVAAGAASPALAQRTTFERSFDVNEAAILDVSTTRGKIDVITGAPGRIVVTPSSRPANCRPRSPVQAGHAVE
jgi:hypothetical protein